jgi:uroporphyrinogen-III synthase
MNSNPKKILSTKSLPKALEKRLTNNAIYCSTYDAINITYHKIQEHQEINHAIFTSSNAVKSILHNRIPIKNAYCVGKNTQALLLKNDIKVIEMCKNASELGKNLIKNHKNNQFIYFSGNLRREALPLLLKENNINFSEIEAYKTTLNIQKFKESFAGVLFFSPSGIKSYITKNNLQNIPAFCIGNTTAEAAIKYTNKVIVAENQTVESVVDTAIKYYKSIPLNIPTND